MYILLLAICWTNMYKTTHTKAQHRRQTTQNPTQPSRAHNTIPPGAEMCGQQPTFIHLFCRRCRREIFTTAPVTKCCVIEYLLLCVCACGYVLLLLVGWINVVFVCCYPRALCCSFGLYRQRAKGRRSVDKCVPSAPHFPHSLSSAAFAATWPPPPAPCCCCSV